MATKTTTLPSDVKRKRLQKVSATTSPYYGSEPQQRSISELVRNGCIIVDKPSGPTSHQVVAWIRDILDLEKAGHGGTLDPSVTGILPTAVGDATRALQVLLCAGKEYVGVMKLHKSSTPEKIRRVCQGMVGAITQMPPVRSAVKRVRRQRQVYYLSILEIQDKDVLFQVGCEAGTYIRTLCVDIGKKLGTGAHLADLRRTRVGAFIENQTVTLHDIQDAYHFWKEDHDESYLRQTIFPMERLLDHVPKIVIRDSAVDAICHGANLAIPGVVAVDSGIKKDDIVGILTLKDEGVAIARSVLSSEDILQKDIGVCATLDRVLMNKGTYPSLWKKS